MLESEPWNNRFGQLNLVVLGFIRDGDDACGRGDELTMTVCLVCPLCCVCSVCSVCGICSVCLLYASGHNFALLGNESSFRFVASSTALNAARESSFHWEDLSFFSFFCFVSSLFAFLIPPFPFCLPLSAPAPREKKATLKKEQNHHISKCRFSVQSARRRQQQPRTIRLGISQKMSPLLCLQRIVSPTFVSPPPVNTLPSRPGIRRSASTRSMSRVRVKERLCLSMRPPS